jgi:hypothetical protein
MFRFYVVAVLVAVGQASAETPSHWTSHELAGPDGAGALVELFHDIAPGPSTHIDGCIEAWRSLERGTDVVIGCAMSISPDDFPKLLFSWGKPLTKRRVTAIHPELEVPPVGPAFSVSDVFFLTPPEQWNINDTLIYTNESRTRIVAYLRKLVVQ